MGGSASPAPARSWLWTPEECSFGSMKSSVAPIGSRLGVPETEHPEPTMKSWPETATPLWLCLGPALPFQGAGVALGFQHSFSEPLLPGGASRRFRGGGL